MKPETRKAPASGAERGRRFRERQRAIAMPTDTQFDRVLREVIFENIASADTTPAMLLTTVRGRLLKTGFSWTGVNSAILKHGAGQ